MSALSNSSNFIKLLRNRFKIVVFDISAGSVGPEMSLVGCFELYKHSKAILSPTVVE